MKLPCRFALGLLLVAIFSFPAVSQLESLSDEFESPCNLENWQRVETVEGWPSTHLESIDVDASNPGQLTMVPYTTAWFADRRSELVFKEVEGDFVFTIEVTAVNKAGIGMPATNYSLAGAMVRTPKGISNATTEWAPNQENYIFLSIGTANNGGSGPQFEIKNTTNSNSVLSISNISSGTAQIRFVRVGQAFIAMYKLPGGNWSIRNRYSRTDMPDNLQVGFVTYADWPKVSTYSTAFQNFNTLNGALNPDPSSNPNIPFNPDLVGQFEFGRFTEVSIPSHLANADFSSTAEVSNTEVLSLFGFDSENSEPSGWKVWKGTTSDWNEPTNWRDGVVPSNQDSVMVPNCNCPSLVFPILTANAEVEIQSWIVEPGGSVTVPTNSTFNVNLQGSAARTINRGAITVFGEFNILNAEGKVVRNVGLLDCKGSCDIGQ